jgi:hypothetical protein
MRFNEVATQQREDTAGQEGTRIGWPKDPWGTISKSNICLAIAGMDKCVYKQNSDTILLCLNRENKSYNWKNKKQNITPKLILPIFLFLNFIDFFFVWLATFITFYKIFLAVLGFELRALCLQGKHSTPWSIPHSTFFKYFLATWKSPLTKICQIFFNQERRRFFWGSASSCLSLPSARGIDYWHISPCPSNSLFSWWWWFFLFCLGFLLRCWGWNPGPHACLASLTELHIQHIIKFLKTKDRK